MIFETKKKDLMVRMERILEVVKEMHKEGRDSVYLLAILTMDSSRVISYDSADDRDEDDEVLVSSMDLEVKIKSAITELDKLLKSE